MRNLQTFLDAYVEHHRHPLNALIHCVCVPLITFTSLALLWLVPVGRWLGLDAALVPYVNLATLLALPIFVFYIRLSVRGALLMALWFFASVAGIVAIQAAGLPLLAISAGLWLFAWVVQIYGHKIEGKKPSFFDDLVFLLIGPLYVNDKLFVRLVRR